MPLPFSSWFKNKDKKESEASDATPGRPVPPAPAASPGSQTPSPPEPRSAKTVTPHNLKPVDLRTGQAPKMPSPSVAGGAKARGKIAFPSAESQVQESSESSAAGVEEAPTGEVKLAFSDFADKIPSSFLNQGAASDSREVTFDVADLYADIKKGRAAVPLSLVAEKAPDLFAKSVDESEDVEVHLPLPKLVSQMDSLFRTRDDQEQQEPVAEFETPFSKAAEEDNAKFGTTAPAAAAPKSPAPPEANKPPKPPAPTPAAEAPKQDAGAGKSAPNLPPLPKTTIRVQGEGGQPAPASPGGGSPILPGKRPPATVRASVAGGKIKLSGPHSQPSIRVAQPQQEAQGSAGQKAEEKGAAAKPPLPKPASGTPPKAPIKLPGTGQPSAGGPKPSQSPSTFAKEKKTTARIHVPPISLKGSGQPPKPTAPPSKAPAPASPQPTTPPPIPDSAPTEASQPEQATPTPASASSQTPPPTSQANTGGKPQDLELGLRPILMALPEETISGDLSNIGDEETVHIPFSLIEPQLAQGRVAIALEEFIQALPDNRKRMFEGADPSAEVPIPLPEIFRSLPMEALELRDDQEVERVQHEFATPFSQKASEDAERFKQEAQAKETSEPETGESNAVESGDEPISAEQKSATPETSGEPAQAPTEPKSPESPESPESKEAETKAGDYAAVGEKIPFGPPRTDKAAGSHGPMVVPPPRLKEASIEEPESTLPEPVSRSAAPKASQEPFDPTQLQALLMTDENLDAKVVVRLISSLPGLKACNLMFGDGLHLAGNFPAPEEMEGFCAMAPLTFSKLNHFSTELTLGEASSFTIFAEKDPVSIFMAKNICMAVQHAGRSFLPGVREKLTSVVHELSKMYGN